MKSIMFVAALVISAFLIKSYSGSDAQQSIDSEAQKKQESVNQLINAPLGLVSKVQITENLEPGATVWKEIHRVEGGVVTFETILFEYLPGKTTTMVKTKHDDLNGKNIYSSIAYSQSKSIVIYRQGKNGVQSKNIGATIQIKFRNTPSDKCLKNQFELIDMPSACNATIKISTGLNKLRLKMSASAAELYDIKGKVKRISNDGPGYSALVETHMKKIYKQVKLAKKLKEPLNKS